MSKLFELIEEGFIKPIAPIHKFAWTDIPAAFRSLRPGTHIGKVVLSLDTPTPEIKVPVSFVCFRESLFAVGEYSFTNLSQPSRFDERRRVSASVLMVAISLSAVSVVSAEVWPFIWPSKERNILLSCYAVAMRTTSQDM
jgi:hypothetical protein